jgi:hypothetical protein
MKTHNRRSEDKVNGSSITFIRSTGGFVSGWIFKGGTTNGTYQNIESLNVIAISSIPAGKRKFRWMITARKTCKTTVFRMISY